ncbi:Methylenetetrahydrofolate reductase 2 [Psilocybe cubensis]|uniref:MTHFR SAM-binding regulatory domain-containing protein n=2 Tax=Psilocybe cubensis TaxID=181762 RepID=A0A8H7Y2C5_PSICU|nr:Methylenetetrahydrofolate reductase 2 [Psilocybe cubensis]KAH9484119.1 Methylenetetrahydrofolate reductase 2 [Psilocybe cubensis]
MKLTDKISARDASNPFFTFEFFPPRTDQGFENLMSRISRLSSLNPLAISVTWGAGGSTKDRSLELAGLTQHSDLDTILHLTCTNMEIGLIDQVLSAAKDQGIHNILALRGDPPRGEEEWTASDPRFTRAVDLVSYIRSIPEYSSWFCVGVAGYPDGHADNPVDEDTEISRLKEKVDAGADFIITQLFYDTNHFLLWYRKVRAEGIDVPVIPGIMPIQTYSSFSRVTKLSGARVPESVSAALAAISQDDRLVKDYGVKLATETVRRLNFEAGIKGFHFCTLNLEKSVQRVLENLGWAGSPFSTQNKLIIDSSSNPPPSNIDSTLVISPSSATNSATVGLSTLATSEGEAGQGELNNAATWDDFPNGRFGDFKSPAFGNQDLYGGFGISKNEALALWGNPKEASELTQIFLNYLHSKIPTTPFSPSPLSPESQMIFSHLENLTKRGWWTVGSQPAVDGTDSSDDVVGWGPRSGYVFQKCFVEFFCGLKEVEEIVKKIEEKGNGWVHYFAGDYKGEFRTNVPANGRNAVTWGVFPGQEIAQTTIIEAESFLSWKDEAFSIWSEWASFYRPGSEERKLLEGVRDDRWLVSIVHHDYKNKDALWTFLLDGH